MIAQILDEANDNDGVNFRKPANWHHSRCSKFDPLILFTQQRSLCAAVVDVMVGAPPVARSQRDGVWAFSEGCRHAAVARPDGSVDVFDMTAGARVVERFAGSPTASGRPSTLAISHKRSRSAFTVATGTPGGDVSVAGRVVTALDGGSVAALVFSDSGLLVCGGADKQVIRVNAETGKVIQRFSIARDHRNTLSSLAVSADGKKAAACSQNISLLDIASGKTVRSFSGHASPITASFFSSNDTRLVTGTMEDQFLYIWDAADEESNTVAEGKSPSSAKKQKRRKKNSRLHPIHTLIAPEQGVRSISVTDNRDGGYSFAAVLKSGVVAVWSKWESGKNASTKSDCTIYPFAEDNAQAAPSVHGAGFLSYGILSVLYGSSLKPQVHSVALEDMAETQHLPKPCSDNLLISHNAPLRTGQVPGIGRSAIDVAQAEVEAPEAITASVTGNTRLPNGEVVPRRKREKRKSESTDAGVGEEGKEEGKEAFSDDEEHPESSSGSDSEAGADEEGDDGEEPTLHERLGAIGVSSGKSDEVLVPVGKSEVKKTLDSRAEVILQAVSSKDEKLLNSVLYQKHPPLVVRATVRQLPSKVASESLLEILVAKLRREPRHVIDIIPWIQTILSEHASALINRRKSSALCDLMDTVTKRNQTLDALNRLEGRLELVVAQANRASSFMKTNLNHAKPQVEYVERVKDRNAKMDDSDEDDEEEASGDTSSDEESGEDSDDATEEMEVVNAGGKGNPAKAGPEMNGHLDSGDDMNSDSSSG